jgi:hypothetical protein
VTGIERQNSVIDFSARSDAGGEKEPAIMPKCKAAGKRNDSGGKIYPPALSSLLAKAMIVRSLRRPT